MSTRFAEVTRRGALQSMAGLVIAVNLPLKAMAQSMGAQAGAFAPNAFVRVAPDSSVTVICRNFEMGQGPYTGFATLVAEELDADWAQMRAEGAPANVALYINPGFGMQATGGSTSLTTSYDEMRRAGAMARALLVQAAAAEWGVPAEEITVDRGTIRHAASGREGGFGQFAEAAGRLTPPDSATVAVKDPSEFRLIGKDDGSVKRIDSPAIAVGAPVFTADIDEPGMLTAVVARAPRFGGVASSVDDADARAIPGVVDVRTLPSGVAVYAEGTWPAMQGAKALTIEWDESAVEGRGSAELFAQFRELAQTTGNIAGEHGDVDAALADADQVIEGTYEFPYLSHSPMEPLNGFIHWDGERARARYASQAPSLDQTTIAGILGVAPEAVSIEVLQAGGSFGRRGQFANTFAAELAEAAKALGPGRPVKVQWTREDDVKGGFYRPMALHRFRGGVKDGRITAWSSTVVAQSLVKGTPFEQMMTNGGIDQMSVEGVSEIPYAIPNFRCDAHNPDIGVPVLFWRSVGHSHTAYAKESFVDEMLAAIGADPVQGRLDLLPADSADARVLRAVAELAGWDGPNPAPGRARGVAVVSSFNTAVAQIAEVAETERGLRVVKMWCAVDCGRAINPDVIRAQMEGGIGFALGHALYAEITMQDGVVRQGNFDTYRSLRMAEMPEIEVHIVPSDAHPTGVGEPGVPPAAPAVANAITALGRDRPRTLPIMRAGNA
jgi:isoquinoline 1-oxidoreductase beta subunit